MRLPASTFSLSGIPDSCNHCTELAVHDYGIYCQSIKQIRNIRNEETWLKLQAGLAYATSDIVSDSYQIFH